VCVTGVLNVTFLNKLFAIFGTLKSIPPYQSTSIIGGLVTGGVMLNEFENYSYSSLLLIAVGTCVCVLGLYFRMYRVTESLTPEPRHKSQNSKESNIEIFINKI
jgi:hypothetical protein